MCARARATIASEDWEKLTSIYLLEYYLFDLLKSDSACWVLDIFVYYCNRNGDSSCCLGFDCILAPKKGEGGFLFFVSARLLWNCFAVVFVYDL